MRFLLGAMLFFDKCVTFAKNCVMRKTRLLLPLLALLCLAPRVWGQGVAESGFNLIVVGDPQPQTKAQLSSLEQEIIPQIGAIVEEYRAQSNLPTAILLTGDVVWDTTKFLPRVKRAFESLGVPVYAVIGNHDHARKRNRAEERAERPYVETFGERNQAFVMGKTIFLTFDNIIYNPDKTYYEGVDARQLVWLSEKMREVPEDMRVAVCMHAPATRLWRGELRSYALPIVDIVGDRELHFITGHAHRHFTATLSPTLIEHSVAQVSGNLWFAPICSDGTPRGVFCIEERNGQWRWHHRMLGKGADERLVVWREGEAYGCEDYVVVKVVGWDDRWRVEWSENGVEMGAMEQVEMKDPDYMYYVDNEANYRKIFMNRLHRSASKRNHYYRLQRTSENSDITITATDRFGRTYTVQL